MPEEEPAAGQARPKRKKRAPAHFKQGGAALVQNLLAGASDVADRSFLGGGSPGPEDVRTAPASASSPAPAPAPAEMEHGGVPAPAVPAEGDRPRSKPAAVTSSSAVASAGTPQSDSVPQAATRRGTVPGRAASPALDQKSDAHPPIEQVAASHAALGALPETEAASEPASTSVSGSLQRTAEPQVPRPRSASAHSAIHDSFADAKLRSARWKSHGFRIAPDVLSRLKERLNADRRSTGNSGLALGHYVDAALRCLPETIDEQIEMAAAFEANQLWGQERTQPSNYRVGESAYNLMSNLKLTLQEADFGRRGTHVVSAGIERLLDALDAEGPLQRPPRQRP